MSRGPTPSAFRLATRSRRVGLALMMPSFLSDPSSTWTLVRGTVVVVPFDSAPGWRDLRRFGHPDGEVALRDGDRADAHVRAHDDRAARLVDHDHGRIVRLDPQIFDLAERLHHVAPVEC